MRLHEDAVRVLSGWAAPDPEQGRLAREYRSHLAAHRDGMWKSCGEGHLTASALVVDPPRQRVLLTLHRKLRRWLQTGGHCEPQDVTLAGAALREATEESGLPGLRLLPGPVRLDRHRTPCAWHLDVQYAVVAPDGKPPAISDESLELRWFGYDEVAGAADDSVVRLMRRTRMLL
ncbi:NUDIX hydrolase [Streptomyces sp. ACA25]|uniref:NUDIX hydrolase n=1 Tax=Streptomyces sp. ACA25 TaxID=3022596 RepID=UPI002307C463|nr:NUDIX hydrolase [Streptomyces sp. ACA25]MDB1086841.1 NUDIX hydrolase [Streptomyces sp. ACA25]